jgi:hypothetical protein
MKVDTRNHTSVIKDTQGDLAAFLDKITKEHKSFEKGNIIIDLTAYDVLPVTQVKTFMPLAKIHTKAKKSFIIVGNTNYHNMGSLVVVPTIQEAHDIIEMDEIERDLGF